MALPELVSPAPWRAIEIVSDLHLAEDTPRGAAAFRAWLGRCTADAVLILGDLFEAWVGDDARQAGFERDCAAMLAAAGRQRWIGFMAGNRDFLVGTELLAACGLHRLEDPTVLVAFGRRWVLSHGDALCIDDVEYQQFRREVRGAAWQQQFLARPLAERREIAQRMREASRARQQGQRPELWADVDADAARALLRDAGSATLIHGHTHRPGRVALGDGLERVVLSDWELDHGGQRSEVLRLDAAGLHRAAP